MWILPVLCDHSTNAGKFSSNSVKNTPTKSVSTCVFIYLIVRLHNLCICKDTLYTENFDHIENVASNKESNEACHQIVLFYEQNKYFVYLELTVKY